MDADKQESIKKIIRNRIKNAENAFIRAKNVASIREELSQNSIGVTDDEIALILQEMENEDKTEDFSQIVRYMEKIGFSHSFAMEKAYELLNALNILNMSRLVKDTPPGRTKYGKW